MGEIDKFMFLKLDTDWLSSYYAMPPTCRTEIICRICEFLPSRICPLQKIVGFAYHYEPETVIRLISDDPDLDRKIILIMSIKYGFEKIIQVLIPQIFPIDFEDNSAMFFACKFGGSLSHFEYLLQNGADVSKIKISLFDELSHNAKKNCAEITKIYKLLLDHHYDPNHINSLSHIRYPDYFKQILVSLLEHGLDINHTESILLRNAISRHDKTIIILLEHGANPNLLSAPYLRSILLDFPHLIIPMIQHGLDFRQINNMQFSDQVVNNVTAIQSTGIDLTPILKCIMGSPDIDYE